MEEMYLFYRSFLPGLEKQGPEENTAGGEICFVLRHVGKLDIMKKRAGGKEL